MINESETVDITRAGKVSFISFLNCGKAHAILDFPLPEISSGSIYVCFFGMAVVEKVG